jgi:hypothetical protein
VRTAAAREHSGVPSMASTLQRRGSMIACPDCENARSVRALALDDNLWTHLLTLALPLLIIAAISLLLHRGAGPVAETARPEGTRDDQ